MNEDLQKIIDHENESWSHIFRKKLINDKQNPKKFSSYWDEKYYKELTDYVNFLFSKYHYSNLLEEGSGSGRSSILLNSSIDKTLLDISQDALEYAKHISRKFNIENVKFVVGDIFQLPFKEQTFDFIWSIGVIEHYNILDIQDVFKEAIRVTKPNGMIAFGVPNFYSGPILKAWTLKYMPKSVQGYRLGTENFYKGKVLRNTLADAAKKEGRDIEYLEARYFGNPLPVESPIWMINSIGKMLEVLFPKNKFIMMIFCKFKK